MNTVLPHIWIVPESHPTTQTSEVTFLQQRTRDLNWQPNFVGVEKRKLTRIRFLQIFFFSPFKKHNCFSDPQLWSSRKKKVRSVRNSHFLERQPKHYSLFKVLLKLNDTHSFKSCQSSPAQLFLVFLQMTLSKTQWGQEQKEEFWLCSYLSQCLWFSSKKSSNFAISLRYWVSFRSSLSLSRFKCAFIKGLIY